MPKIEIPQKNLVFDSLPNENLMDALIRAGLPVASSCLGEGICSKCVVKITPPSKPTDLEVRTMTRNKLDLSATSNLRLSCQVFVDTDIVVSTTYW